MILDSIIMFRIQIFVFNLYGNFHPVETILANAGDQQVELKWSSERITESSVISSI